MADTYSTLTQAEVQELFNYDPEVGVLTHKTLPKNTNRKVYIGKPAGHKHRSGYVCVYLKGRTYKAHRLIWLYTFGKWPTKQLDHINGVRDDNRISNLREATQLENSQNRKLNNNNASGYLGVSCMGERWRAVIGVNKHVRYLGLFSTKEEAYTAYCKAKAELHQFNPVLRVTA